LTPNLERFHPQKCVRFVVQMNFQYLHNLMGKQYLLPKLIRRNGKLLEQLLEMM
jgi:hypothetical protein